MFFQFLFTGLLSKLHTNKRLHPNQSQQDSRQHFQTGLLHGGSSSATIPPVKELHRLLTAIVYIAKQHSIATSSHGTYRSALKKFFIFLRETNLTMDLVLSSSRKAHKFICWYVSWLFARKNFQCSSITTYLAGLQFHINNTFSSPISIWHKELHRVLAGFRRLQVLEAPIFNKAKLPFTRALILLAQFKVLD